MSTSRTAIDAAAGLMRKVDAPALRRHGVRRRRRSRDSIARRPLRRRRRPRAERRSVPQHQGRADERLDHVHAHRDAQPRRPHRDRRQRRAQAARPLLRPHRLPGAFDVRRRCPKSARSSSSARASTPRSPRATASARSSTCQCPNDRLTEVLGALHARLRGLPAAGARDSAAEARRHPLIAAAVKGTERTAPEIAGVKLSRHRSGWLRSARPRHYGVVVWAPPGLSFAQADLAVHAISEVVKELNLTTRASPGFRSAATKALPAPPPAQLADRLSAARELRQRQARIRFLPLRDRPHARRERRRSARLARLLHARPLGPPRHEVPTIVLGTPGLSWPSRRRCSFPVGTPGIDHAGMMVRGDNVVSLPLARTRPLAAAARSRRARRHRSGPLNASSEIKNADQAHRRQSLRPCERRRRRGARHLHRRTAASFRPAPEARSRLTSTPRTAAS